MFQPVLSLQNPILRERRPGRNVLYNEASVTVICQRGWAGKDCDICAVGWAGPNCDSCDINFRPPGQCDQCLRRWAGENCSQCATGWTGDKCDACAVGWTGDDCDTCADGWLPPTCDQICDGFGCCNQGECEGCIQDGRWIGSVGYESFEVHMTFKGDRCMKVVPGELKYYS